MAYTTIHIVLTQMHVQQQLQNTWWQRKWRNP